MTPTSARRLARWLHLFAIMFALGALAPAVYLTLEIFYGNNTQSTNKELEWPKTESPKLMPMTDDFLRAIHEAKIEEKRDRVVPASEPPTKVEVPKPQTQPVIDYELIGIMANAETMQSFAVLKDKRSGKQILIREGKTISNTTWKVTRIKRDRVEIDCNDICIELIRPKHWNSMARKESKRNNIVAQDGQIEPQLNKSKPERRENAIRRPPTPEFIKTTDQQKDRTNQGSPQPGEFIKSADHYRQMLKDQPNRPETHLALGRHYMADRKTQDKALEHFQKVLELEPNHAKKKIVELWIKQLQNTQ